MINFLFIFVDKEQFNRCLFYLLIIILFLTGIARLKLIAFLPVYLVLLSMTIYGKRIRDIQTCFSSVNWILDRR
jgi:hypothetical protein